MDWQALSFQASSFNLERVIFLASSTLLNIFLGYLYVDVLGDRNTPLIGATRVRGSVHILCSIKPPEHMRDHDGTASFMEADVGSINCRQLAMEHRRKWVCFYKVQAANSLKTCFSERHDHLRKWCWSGWSVTSQHCFTVWIGIVSV